VKKDSKISFAEHSRKSGGTGSSVGSKIQRFKDSKIQTCPTDQASFHHNNSVVGQAGIQRFKDSKIQKFKNSKIQKFKNSKIQPLSALAGLRVTNLGLRAWRSRAGSRDLRPNLL
jgi:hypothetical protein